MKKVSKKRYVVFYLDKAHKYAIHPFVLSCFMVGKTKLGTLIRFHQKHHYIHVVGCVKERIVKEYAK